MPNIILFTFDLLCLPISIIRLIIIYFFGSKYNLKGFKFLDVITHADKPYFNTDDVSNINTLKDDYRLILRDDTRIYPLDVLTLLKNMSENKEESDDYQEIENDNKEEIIKSIKNELESFFI